MRRMAGRLGVVSLATVVVASAVAFSGLVPTAQSSSEALVVQAAEQIEHEAAYVNAVLKQSGRPQEPRGYVLALLTMDYVVGHISAPMFGHLVTNDPGRAPRGDDVQTVAERSLAAGAGICGNAAATFAAILDRLGVESRSVQFYFDTGNHIAVEVLYEGRWHYFDPTWGTFYRPPGPGNASNVLSVAEIRALERPYHFEVANHSHAWKQIVRSIPGVPQALGLDHLTRPERIMYGAEF